MGTHGQGHSSLHDPWNRPCYGLDADCSNRWIVYETPCCRIAEPAPESSSDFYICQLVSFYGVAGGAPYSCGHGISMGRCRRGTGDVSIPCTKRFADPD